MRGWAGAVAEEAERTETEEEAASRAERLLLDCRSWSTSWKLVLPETEEEAASKAETLLLLLLLGCWSTSFSWILVLLETEEDAALLLLDCGVRLNSRIPLPHAAWRSTKEVLSGSALMPPSTIALLLQVCELLLLPPLEP